MTEAQTDINIPDHSWYGMVFKYLYSAPHQPWANRGALGSSSSKKKDKFQEVIRKKKDWLIRKKHELMVEGDSKGKGKQPKRNFLAQFAIKVLLVSGHFPPLISFIIGLRSLK